MRYRAMGEPRQLAHSLASRTELPPELASGVDYAQPPNEAPNFNLPAARSESRAAFAIHSRRHQAITGEAHLRDFHISIRSPALRDGPDTSELDAGWDTESSPVSASGLDSLQPIQASLPPSREPQRAAPPRWIASWPPLAVLLCLLGVVGGGIALLKRPLKPAASGPPRDTAAAPRHAELPLPLAAPTPAVQPPSRMEQALLPGAPPAASAAVDQKPIRAEPRKEKSAARLRRLAKPKTTLKPVSESDRETPLDPRHAPNSRGDMPHPSEAELAYPD